MILAWVGAPQKNVTLPQVFFKYFASKNQLPGFYISGTLVENELIILEQIFRCNSQNMEIKKELCRIDRSHLFWFGKLARMHVNLAGKKQGKYKLRQMKRSFSDGKNLGRVRISFEFRKWR